MDSFLANGTDESNASATSLFSALKGSYFYLNFCLDLYLDVYLDFYLDFYLYIYLDFI